MDPSNVFPSRLVPYSPTWHVAKIVLRSLSTICCIVLIVLGAISQRSTRYDDGTHSYILIFPPSIGALIVNCIEFVTLCVRYKVHRGLHPGIWVGVDLLVWTGAAVCLGILPVVGSGSDLRYEPHDTSLRLDIGAICFLSVLALIHFILFCRACRETHQRNSAKQSIQYVFTPNGGVPFPVLVNVNEPAKTHQPTPEPLYYIGDERLHENEVETYEEQHESPKGRVVSGKMA